MIYMDIMPVNGHLLIKPLEHKTFLPTEKGTFEEIGIVLELPATLCGSSTSEYGHVEKGDRVYFDGWLSAKFPTGQEDEYFWLVPYKDVRAIQKNEKDQIPE